MANNEQSAGKAFLDAEVRDNTSAGVAAIRASLALVQAVLGSLLDQVTELGSAVATALLPVFQTLAGVASYIAPLFGPLIGALIDLTDAALNNGGVLAILAAAAAALAVVLAPLYPVIGTIATVLGVAKVAADLLSAALYALRVAFQVLMIPINLVIGALKLLWQAFNMTIGLAIRFVTSLPRLMLGAFTAIARGARDLAKQIIQWLGVGLTAALTLAKTIATTVATTLARIVINPGKTIVAPIVSALTSVTDFVGSKLQAIGDLFTSAGKRIATIGVTIAGIGALIVAPLTAAANEFTKFGDTIASQAKKAKVAADFFSGLAFAAKDIDLDPKNLAAGMKQLDKILKEADKRGQRTLKFGIEIEGKADLLGLGKDTKSTKAIADLGLDVQELLAMNAENRFLKIGEAIAQIEDDAKRAAVAAAIFGKENKEILDLFDQGAAGIQQMFEKAQSLGQIISPEDAATAKALKAVLDDLKLAWKGVYIQLGAIVAPAIKEWTDVVLGAVKMGIKWIQENRALIAQAFNVASAVASAGAALTAIGGILSAVGAGFGGLAGLAAFVSASIATIGGAIVAILSPMAVLIAGLSIAGVTLAAWLNPIALIRTGLASLGPAWGNLRNQASEAVQRVMATLGELSAWFGEVLGSIYGSIAAGDLAGAFDVLLASARVALARGFLELQTLTQGFLGGFFAALASGDFSGAWKAITNGLQIAFAEAMAFILPLWNQLKGAIDGVVTYLRQAWNSALSSMAEGIVSLMKSLANMLENTWDPTGNAKKAADALRDAVNSDSLTKLRAKKDENKSLDAGLQERNAARDAATQAEIEGYRKQIDRLTAEQRADATNGTKGLSADLEWLRNDLEDAIEAARQSKEQAMPKDLEGIVRNANIEVTGARRAMGGAYGGAAAAALAGNSPAEQAAKDTAKNTKESVAALKTLIQIIPNIGVGGVALS